MANIYVRSTDGSDADNGSTWVLAKQTTTGAAAIDAAGDNIFLSKFHAESTNAAVGINSAGTPANPVKIISVDDAAEPPTTPSAGATITTTGNFGITFTGSNYVYGVTFDAGTGASGTAATITCNATTGAASIFENCTFRMNTTSGSQIIQAITNGSSPTTQVIWKNCHVKTSHVSQAIAAGRGKFVWEGGSLLAGSSVPTGLFRGGNQAFSNTEILISGVDLSNGGTGMVIFHTTTGGGRWIIRNCKLPAGWTGSLLGVPTLGCRAEMYNCDSGDTNYRLWIEDYCGSIKSETTLIRTGGASDGTTGFSWKMGTSANVSAYAAPLISPELPAVWNTTVGSAVTVTVDVIHDSLTALKDDEIWLEVQYLGTSGFPLSSFISDAKADVLATAVSQDASAATWTTTGMTNPNEQKLSVTFTPQEVGFIQAKVYSGKASYTVYVDPKLQVS